MAERRMFSKTITDSDLFLEMPATAQLLYFHLSMHADDDGFLKNPRSIMRMVGSKDDDMKLLIAKQFLIPFESGVVVIKHWKIHNYIRSDRYKPTICEEKSLVTMGKDMVYQMTTDCLPIGIPNVSLDGYQMDTQDRIGKDRIGKDSLSDDGAQSAPAKQKPHKKKYGSYNHVRLTDEEFNRLVEEYGETITAEYIKKVDEYCELKGAVYKNHNLAIRNFLKRDNVKKKPQPVPPSDSGLINQSQKSQEPELSPDFVPDPDDPFNDYWEV